MGTGKFDWTPGDLTMIDPISTFLDQRKDRTMQITPDQWEELQHRAEPTIVLPAYVARTTGMSQPAFIFDLVTDVSVMFAIAGGLFGAMPGDLGLWLATHARTERHQQGTVVYWPGLTITPGEDA